jgi:MarR family transcriptional regulator, temperature-dependent positive regulator of motility
MPQKTSGKPLYAWAKFVLSPDTIVPHRVPFALARRFQQVCNTVLAETLAGEEVSTPLVYHALALIDDFPGIEQRRLAVLMGIDRTNAGQIVDELEAKGLVRRSVNGADRRARELHATTRAVNLRCRMRPRVLAAQASVLTSLKAAERVLLVDLLTRVVEANEIHARPGVGRRRPGKRKTAAVQQATESREHT